MILLLLTRQYNIIGTRYVTLIFRISESTYWKPTVDKLVKRQKLGVDVIIINRKNTP